VLCFDQTVLPVFSGKASSFSADAQQAILQRNALGASDLTGALRYLKEHPARHERVIVVSDGILTAGALERDQLKAAAAELKQIGVQRIDAIVDGGVQDEISLEQLTVAGLERDGIVVRASLPAPLLASRIIRATRSGLKVKVPGATWVWPETLDAVQPGDQVLVFADLPPGTPMKVELGEKGEDLREVALTDAERPLLERAWVKANIDRLSANPGTTPAEKSEVRKQILDLSTKYRVLSDYTALLVLETDCDYQRFGIDRTALAEILTVGPAGITTIDRRRMPTKNAMPVVANIREEEEDVGLIDSLFGSKKMMDSAAAPASARAEAPAFEARNSRDGRRGRGRRRGRRGPAPPRRGGPHGPADRRRRQPQRGDGPRRARRRPARSFADARAPRRRSRADDEGERRGAEGRHQVEGLHPPARARPLECPAPCPAPCRPPRRASATSPAPSRRRAGAAGARRGASRPGRTWLAARAYGSIIDLFSARADLRRFAGERLERLGSAAATSSSTPTSQAVADRPDHLSGHRMLAMALVRAGRHADALAAIWSWAWRRTTRRIGSAARPHPARGPGLIGAAWLAKAAPGQRAAITGRLAKLGARLATAAVDALRPVLGDRRQRRRLPHPRRPGRPRLLQPEAAAVGR
jgi:hypothetical protein